MGGLVEVLRGAEENAGGSECHQGSSAAQKSRDESKPCRGVNANVCVAEGCYGEACVDGRSEGCEGRSGGMG